MRPFPKLGQILGKPFGIEAYSNYGIVYDFAKEPDYRMEQPKEKTGLIRDVRTGYTYQCVEYARRFQVFHQKVAFADIPTARDIWDLTTVDDLTQENSTFPFASFPQGSEQPPQVSDLVIYEKSEHQKFGHVAVIIRIDLENMNYDVAEQNYEDHGWDTFEYSRRLELKRINGLYYLTNHRIEYPEQVWDKDEVIVGWKRVIKP